MSCKICGECCRWLTLHPSWFDYDLEYMKARGGKLISGIAFFSNVCHHLNEDGECKTYNHRPRFCRQGKETNYTALKKLGCKFHEDEIAMNGDLNIHVTEGIGAIGRLN